jgi:hypothetical protein
MHQALLLFLNSYTDLPAAVGEVVYLNPVLSILDLSRKIPIIVVIDMGISFYF